MPKTPKQTVHLELVLRLDGEEIATQEVSTMPTSPEHMTNDTILGLLRTLALRGASGLRLIKPHVLRDAFARALAQEADPS